MCFQVEDNTWCSDPLVRQVASGCSCGQTAISLSWMGAPRQFPLFIFLEVLSFVLIQSFIITSFFLWSNCPRWKAQHTHHLQEFLPALAESLCESTMIPHLGQNLHSHEICSTVLLFYDSSSQKPWWIAVSRPQRRSLSGKLILHQQSRASQYPRWSPTLKLRLMCGLIMARSIPGPLPWSLLTCRKIVSCLAFLQYNSFLPKDATSLLVKIISRTDLNVQVCLVTLRTLHSMPR